MATPNYSESIFPPNPTGETREYKTTYMASGLAKSSQDTHGTVNYTYHGSGQPSQVQFANTASNVTIGYDAYGRQQTLSDPGLGNFNYDYWNTGELKEQKYHITKDGAAVDIITGFTYDKNGRPLTKTVSGNTTTYEYEAANVASKGQLKKVSAAGAGSEIIYDALGRIKEQKETIGTQVYSSTHEYYTTNGNLKSITYPNGVVLTYDYHPLTGELYKVNTNKTGTTLVWELQKENASGQAERCKLGNGLTVQYTYDGLNNPKRITAGLDDDGDENFTGVVFRQEIITEAQTGNITRRGDLTRGLYEDFTYDLDRLKDIKESIGVQQNKATRHWEYAIGNIKLEQEIPKGGTIPTFTNNYYYELSIRPDALTKIDNADAEIPITELRTEYTAFDKISKITYGAKVLEFTYGADEERRVMVEKLNGNVVKKTYYLGDYEFETDANDNKTTERTYIWAASGLIGILIKKDGVEKMYYAHTDHLGSILKLTNTDRTTAAEYSYDAWGRRRNPDNWNNTPLDQSPAGGLLTRGYTFHEHLDGYGIINMNGRLYDPALGRFLSPDPFVQDPSSIMSYNRFAYLLNNPLKYTDPSGYIMAGDITKDNHMLPESQVTAPPGGGSDFINYSVPAMPMAPTQMPGMNMLESRQTVQTGKISYTNPPKFAALKTSTISESKSTTADWLSSNTDIISGIVYSEIDAFYILGQTFNPFIQRSYIHHWNGEATTPMENMNAFGQVGTQFAYGGSSATKIIGTGQSTGTMGHATLSRLTAFFYALNPAVEKVTLDLGIRRLTGMIHGLKNFRPDVGIKWFNGKIKAIEIASKTDDIGNLNIKYAGYKKATGSKVNNSTYSQLQWIYKLFE